MEEGKRSHAVYGTSATPGSLPSFRRLRSHTSRTIAIVACAAALSLIALMAVTTSVAPDALFMGDEMDVKYLTSEAHGKEGGAFVQRLQDMWFVMSNKPGMEALAKEASGVAVSMLSASYPEAVKTSLNLEVNPCEDFYEYACGGWDKANRDKIPKYETSKALSWDRAQLNIQDEMVKLLETDQGVSGKYYRSCVDTKKINAEGSKPLTPWLNLIEQVQDQNSLLDVVVELNKGNMDILFSWYIDTDSHDNSQNAFFLSQSDVSLPDTSYYTEDSAEMQGHRAKFEERVGYFFKLVGRENYKDEAKRVVAFETAMAKAMVDRTESYKSHAKKATWTEMDQMTPSWKWKAWLNKLAKCTKPFNGMPSFCKADHTDIMQVGQENGKPLYIRDKDFFPRLETILKTTDYETIKAQMRWQVINGAASSLSTDFQDALLDWYKDLYGVQERSARPRKCFFATTGAVSWASAKLYSDKLFQHENRDAALAMLDNIRAEFMTAIPNADWMTPKNREDAQHKLKEMIFQVGIPTDKQGNVDWPEQTYQLDGHVGDNYFMNGEIVTRMGMERSMEKLSKKPERRSWGGNTPLEVNAFYGPKNNGLWIPAGILQAPFFDYKNSDAENYGSVGTILGHEMSHGFDDDGRQYDAKGEMKPWWEKATVEGFKQRSSCISNLFSKFKVMDKNVNGKLTLGEDIADAGGIKFSYRAFLASKARSHAEKRLFFTSFAQTWCEVDRKKSAISSVLTDAHAPGKFRVIGALTQFAPFAEVFQCPSGSPMAPKDETRCQLW